MTAPAPSATDATGPGEPLAGLRVVEVAFGISAVGAGLAASLPGALLRDFGAKVRRVCSARRSALDAGVEFGRVWDRGKEIVEVDETGDDAPATVATLAHAADVVFLAGPEESIERRGIGCADLLRANPRLVAVRIRPSVTALGDLPDLELLLAARVGLLTQIRGHRTGPKFADLTVAAAGAGLAATAGALALLYERAATGRGGWAETSLADGLQAILPMIIGRVENMSPSTTLLWKEQGPSESLAYRCADGEYVQLWFGAKGAYEAFLERMGDPPSPKGYNDDMFTGAMAERSARWAARFATQDRAHWLAELAGAPFRCEPVLRPGEALLDDHVRQTGLSVEYDDPRYGRVTALGRIGVVTPVPDPAPNSAPNPALTAEPPTTTAPRGPGGPATPGRLLTGVRVLDLSAYLAGPITPLVLAELGADVVKVEPRSGDVHRSMEPMFAAGQRGKRAVAVDLKAPGAARVLDALFRWSDVVHHNSRVGLAERLGYGEPTVRAANPRVVYSHASGFGATGPRAKLAANDHLMQALSGVEAAQGGARRPPTFLVWGAIDVASGWVSACAVLAGLYARRVAGGAGQSVATSLLGTALLLKSGAFVAGDTLVAGPVLDDEQTGYGAAYRIYQAGDGAWFALAVPDAVAWDRLRAVVDAPGLPEAPPPPRTDRSGAHQPAEDLLSAAFRTDDADSWVTRLRAAGVPVEPVAEVDRTGFVARLVDDPVSRQLGRVASYDWGARGRLDQPGFPLRFGPEPAPGARRAIPGLGEHTAEVLAALGFDDRARASLAADGAIPAEPQPATATV
ncbi:CoA transferase [Frankia nepalensis]|uniref:CoA transferase n=1 Tax=Frankia nepalensis TaxID=1836974 RepID=A0A937UUX1_9ACTN|nr:CoA transferase [Frankia nepalensis]MBL7500206.1 CoA transferase [Frankia nepalensis]MBL7509414.1 CoA transferase [Frankia nepalensis]MBL7631636.1 CoA transferase [Frankia nepalensis]